MPNSSCHFPNHKSVALQVLHHSSVSWKITSLYFFRWNIQYFAQQEPVKVQIFQTFECSGQNSPNSFLKQQISFFSNFASLFRVMIHNPSVLFILPTKGTYQITNLVKFYLSSQKSEILHYDGLLLSKSCTVSGKKVQKKYLSWHWRVIQTLKKNSLFV